MGIVFADTIRKKNFTIKAQILPLINTNCRDQDSNLGYYGIIVLPQRRVLTTRRSRRINLKLFLNKTMAILAIYPSLPYIVILIEIYAAFLAQWQSTSLVVSYLLTSGHEFNSHRRQFLIECKNLTLS